MAPSDDARAASRWAVDGAIARIYENRAALQRAEYPSGPSMTSSTSGESGSMVMMRVARRATSTATLPERHQPRPVRRRGPGPAVGDDGEARLQQVFRHGPSHDTESDESNGAVMGRKYMCAADRWHLAGSSA